MKKKLIGFDQPMLDALEQRKKSGFGRDETDVLRKLLAGEQKFMPSIEKYLEREQKARGLNRDEMIQMILLEALKLKDSRFQLP